MYGDAMADCGDARSRPDPRFLPPLSHRAPIEKTMLNNTDREHCRSDCGSSVKSSKPTALTTKDDESPRLPVEPLKRGVVPADGKDGRLREAHRGSSAV